MCGVKEVDIAKFFFHLSLFPGRCCSEMEGNSTVLVFRRKLEADVLSSSTKRRISQLEAVRKQLRENGMLCVFHKVSNLTEIRIGCRLSWSLVGGFILDLPVLR